MKSLAVVVLLIATLGACDSDPKRPSQTPSPSATSSPLNAPKEALIGIWGRDPRDAPGDEIGFNFETNLKFVGDDGCNAVSGSWRLDPANGRLRMSDVMQTLAACPGRPVVDLDSLRFTGTRVEYATRDGEKRFLTSLE